MRDIVWGAVLLIVIAVVAIAPNIGRDGVTSDALAGGSPTASATRPAIASPRASPIGLPAPSVGAPGFGICRADRAAAPAPAKNEAALVLGGDFAMTWEELVDRAGLKFDAHARANALACAGAEPQVWLFGFTPTRYYADLQQDPSYLYVEPAPGYTIVILSGPVTPVLVVATNVKVAVLNMPSRLITPRAAPPAKSLPVPAIPTASANAMPTPALVFPKAERPIDFALPATCRIEDARMHDDDLGAVWRIQCGSAAANRSVADAAIAQGWHLLPGNPPIGVGLQNYTKQTPRAPIWMQIAFRLDGPAFADTFTLIQTYRSPYGP